ncbi:hypothetical protein [Marinobacter sp.]|uniref:hypothetical protein n=1 Tax=Marinobacter sp. TaxID=50741 RepID=UPI003B529D8E
MRDLNDLMMDLDRIADIAYELSQHFGGVETSCRKKKTSTYYLAKIVPECLSLLRILPGSRFTDPGDLFDFPSFCSISRNLIEAANLHWYYCVDQTDSDLSEFRFHLYDFHDYRARIRIGRFLGAAEEELDSLSQEADQIKAIIKDSAFFTQLLPEVQRQILKGRRCAEFNQSEMVEKREIDVEFFNGIHKLLSTNTHSTPSAISAVVHSQLKGTGLQNAFSCLVLSYVTSFVAELVRSTGSMWKMQFDNIESKKLVYSYAGALK